MFDDETKFEDTLCKELTRYGWNKNILAYCDEQDLLKNWADNLFRLNHEVLDDVPLSDTEMRSLLSTLVSVQDPIEMNELIVGGLLSVKRDIDSPQFQMRGKPVYLKIYERNEIGGGDSGYQIARQTYFEGGKTEKNRRGDVTLLINGLPFIHIELKKSGVPIEQAETQIEKYSSLGIFKGFFSVIQIFVAMNPEDMVYFANVGSNNDFDRKYYFHWADTHNNPVTFWKDVVEQVLSIPMAHQLIGYYTVPDKTDGVLKVMRSYQIHATKEIRNRVQNWNREACDYQGGYVWHTTGSGKTMTSFKAAQLIQDYVDKVVFITDRIELGTQSTSSYKNFVVEGKDKVVEASSASGLVGYLKQNPNEVSNAYKLITVSMQKINKLSDSFFDFAQSDIRKIDKMKIVFIIDEAHRSVYGKMFRTLRDKFPHAIIFGFTGTPIFEFNKKSLSNDYNKSGIVIKSDAVKLQTEDIFGSELHSYTIADGIRDGNVLPFDIDAVRIINDDELREAVARDKAKISKIENATPDQLEIYEEYMYDKSKHPMAGYRDSNDKYHKGIEDEMPMENYQTEEYRKAVVNDVNRQWFNRSVMGKFHSIFACSSIKDACRYFKLFNEICPERKVTCLFDENESGTEPWLLNGKEKHDVISEMLDNYNGLFHTNYSAKTYDDYKADVRSRLAHKDAYKHVEKAQQLDIVIVVDQLLTGYDSKWINAMYIDKLLEDEYIIQAFSRTNRLCGAAKQHGYIRYYRKVNTMERNIEFALNAYSNHNPSVFKVNKLKENIAEMNKEMARIRQVFIDAGIEDYAHLPDDENDRWEFVTHFEKFAKRLEAATMQGFSWKSKHGYSGTEKEYRIFLQRYNEFLEKGGDGERTNSDPRVPLDVTYGNFGASNILADKRFFDNLLKKVVSARKRNDTAEMESFIAKLHSSYAERSVTDQKYLDMLLRDIENDTFDYDESISLDEYIKDYKQKHANSEFVGFGNMLGVDVDVLTDLVRKIPLGDEKVQKEGGYLEKLESLVDKKRFSIVVEEATGEKQSLFYINANIQNVIIGFCKYIDKIDRNIESEPFDMMKFIRRKK